MKFKIRKKELLAALKTVGKGASKKSTVMWTKCVLVEVKQQVLSLTTNNLTMAIHKEMECHGSENGSSVLDCAQFTTAVDKMPEEELTISTEKDGLVIRSQRSRLRLPVFNTEDFICPQEETADVTVEISEFVLKYMVSDVKFAAGNGSGNEMFCAINVEIKDDILRLTALDGFRIAVREETIAPTGVNQSCVINAEALSDIASLLSEEIDSKVIFNIWKTGFSIRKAGLIITGRLINGKYFKTEEMFLIDPTVRVSFDKEELEEAVDRCIFATTGVNKPMVFEVENTVRIRAEALASVDEELTAKIVGNPITIGFNPVFIKDIVKTYPDDEITFCFSNSKQPAVVKTDGYSCLLLPVSFD